VQLALETLAITERIDYVGVVMSIGYPNITVIQQAIVSLEAQVIEQEYGVTVRYQLRVPRANVDQLRMMVADATRGEGEFSVNADRAG